MKIEEKFVVSLLRHENIDLEYYNDINALDVINILIEQKIFLAFADKLLDIKLFFKYKSEILNYKKMLIISRNKYMVVFRKIVKILNENNINYYIYKGLPLEKLVYFDNVHRQFSDIDIYCNNKDIDKIISLIKNNFQKVIDYSESILEITGERKIVIQMNNLMLAIEFKTLEHFFKPKFLSPLEIMNDDYIIKTFNLEETFTYLLKYYIEFTTNYIYLKETKKINFQYALDLYNFIKKYQNVLDYNILKEILQYNNISYEELKSVYNELKFIFFKNDISMNEKLQELSESNNNRYLVFDNIQTLNRYFNNDELCTFLENFMLGKLYLENNIENLPFRINPKFDLVKNINIYYKKDLNIELELAKYSDGLAIQLCIFGYRTTGEYIIPYIPLSIRKVKNNYLCTLYYAPTGNSLWNDLEEEEMKYGYIDDIIQLKVKEGKMNLEINLEKFPHKLDIQRKIGINLYLYEIEKNSILQAWCLKPFYAAPFLLNKEESNNEE